MADIKFHLEPSLLSYSKAVSIRVEVTPSSLQPLSKEGLLRYASSPFEKEAVLFIGRFLSPSSSPNSYIATLPSAKSMELLKLVAATGKFFFKNKQVAADLFGRVELFYVLDKKDAENFILQAFLKTAREEYSLSSCDYLCPGPPLWFIRNSFLNFSSQEPVGKWMGKLLSSPSSLLLNKEEHALFIEDHTDLDDPSVPKITYLGNSASEPPTSLQPYPVLKLQDRMGAFASLYMDYGKGIEIPFHDQAKKIPGKNRATKEEGAWEKDLLETSFIRKNTDDSHYYCPVDKVAKSLSFLLECGWKILDQKNNLIKLAGKGSLAFEESPLHVLIKGKIPFDTFEANLSEVVGAFNRRQHFMPLAPGVVGLLPEKGQNTSFDSLAEEGVIVSEGVKIRKNQLSTLDCFQEYKRSLPLTLERLQERLQNFKQIEQALPSSSFIGQLRPYQQLGVNWLNFLYDYEFHGLLADDMGLGKTVQVLAFLSRLSVDKPSLIIVPTSLLFNWQHEFGTFLNTSACLFHGPQRCKDLQLLKQSRFILTTYTTLKIDLPLLSQIDYDCVILDEAQTIKNANTHIFKAVCQLSSRFRLSITGTPLENRLEELGAHFHFLMPDLLGNQETFAATVQAASVDFRHLQKIRQKIHPFFLRRTKEEVAPELPERIEQVVWVEMGEQQRQHYDDFLARAKNNLLKKVALDNVNKHRFEILEVILRLRQLCCDPRLVNILTEEEAPAPSAKLEALLLDLETLASEGRKALIYSQFTSMLHLLARHADERRWRYVLLEGSTTNREGVVTQFQEDPSIPFFFISLKAGGSGLNLTAADAVLLYDPWWNEAVENQAISRAHRLGRKERVIAKRYVMLDSIEDKMMKLKAHKSTLVEALFEGEGLAHTSLSAEDLEFLLS